MQCIAAERKAISRAVLGSDDTDEDSQIAAPDIISKGLAQYTSASSKFTKRQQVGDMQL